MNEQMYLFKIVNNMFLPRLSQFNEAVVSCLGVSFPSGFIINQLVKECVYTSCFITQWHIKLHFNSCVVQLVYSFGFKTDACYL